MHQRAKTAIQPGRLAAQENYGNPLDEEPYWKLPSNHLTLSMNGLCATTSDIEQLPITESYRTSGVPLRDCRSNQPVPEPGNCSWRVSDQFNIIPACCGEGASSPVMSKATTSLLMNGEPYRDPMNFCSSHHLNVQQAGAPSVTSYHLNAQQPCAPSVTSYHLRTHSNPVHPQLPVTT